MERPGVNQQFLDSNPVTALQALLLGEGSNFRATKPDTLSIYETHSVSWLAQFVCQIVTALKWESEFRCDGIDNLADFKAVAEELNTVDPGSYVFRLPTRAEGRDSVVGGGKLTIREFAGRMDALLELSDSTADGLAAEWDNVAALRWVIRHCHVA